MGTVGESFKRNMTPKPTEGLRDPGEYLLMNRRRGRILLRSSSETLRGVDSVRDRLLLHALLYARQWGGLLFSDFCVIAAGQGPKMRGNEW